MYNEMNNEKRRFRPGFMRFIIGICVSRSVRFATAGWHHWNMNFGNGVRISASWFLKYPIGRVRFLGVRVVKSACPTEKFYDNQFIAVCIFLTESFLLSVRDNVIVWTHRIIYF